MKRFIITENERKNILKNYGIILEQDETSLDATAMLDKIQSSLGTSNDVIIGPSTTKLIVSALQGTSTTSDFSCVTNHPSKKRVAYDDNTTGFQIGDLVFDKKGNYYNVKDETIKYTYKCSGTTIQTSNNGEIIGETKKDNTEEIKKIIKLAQEKEFSKEDLKNQLLSKFTQEEIIKADPSLTSLFGTISPETKPEVKVDTKPTMSKGEIVTDENNLFSSTVFDKTGNIPPLNPLG